jgi:hypothetical protein
MSYSGWA